MALDAASEPLIVVPMEKQDATCSTVAIPPKIKFLDFEYNISDIRAILFKDDAAYLFFTDVNRDTRSWYLFPVDAAALEIKAYFNHIPFFNSAHQLCQALGAPTTRFRTLIDFFRPTCTTPVAPVDITRAKGDFYFSGGFYKISDILCVLESKRMELILVFKSPDTPAVTKKFHGGDFIQLRIRCQALGVPYKKSVDEVKELYRASMVAELVSHGYKVL